MSADENTVPGEVIVPLYEERANITKRQIVTGQVTVSSVTREHEQLLDELLDRETVEVRRLPIGRMVDTIPAVREEGDTIIVPVVEEVLVLQRRLQLKRGSAHPARARDREISEARNAAEAGSRGRARSVRQTCCRLTMTAVGGVEVTKEKRWHTKK